MTTGHRVVVWWMGEDVETLADLFPPSPRAVCVGINPAPPSVAAGHYFQGRLGQQFFGRLRQSGLLEVAATGFEDDAAVRAGIGFTDLVKRPTARAGEVGEGEMRHGTDILRRRIEDVGAPVLIFPFKAAATHLVGHFPGNGWIDARFAGAEVFVMPGPYEARATATVTIASLGARFEQSER